MNNVPVNSPQECSETVLPVFSVRGRPKFRASENCSLSSDDSSPIVGGQSSELNEQFSLALNFGLPYRG